MKYNERHKLAEAAARIAASNQLAADRFSPMQYPASLEEALGGKTVLVTGGTGSIGREIVEQVLCYHPKVVRVFSRNEYNQYAMRAQFGERQDIRYFIGDVRDRERLMRACEDVQVLFHAAALKHVDICEYNPFEAVKTNVIGTQNCVEAALDYNMELLVGISTDKAVSPTNTMGATKLLEERLVLAASRYKGDRRTRFCVIRFGNVLASRGSAIPMFISQIKAGGPVTLTHHLMRRFFMSIPQAVRLALQASLESRGGEIYILKMPVLAIRDLCEALVRIYAPRFGRDPAGIEIREVGLKPGEKLYEALMTPEEALHATEQGDYFVVEPLKPASAARLAAAAEGAVDGQDRHIAAGYDSSGERLLSVDEIAALLQSEGLVEQFLEPAHEVEERI